MTVRWVKHLCVFNLRESITNYRRVLENYNTDIKYWQRGGLWWTWWTWCGKVHLHMKQASLPLKYPHGVYGERVGQLEPGAEGISGSGRRFEPRERERAERREQESSFNPTERAGRHRRGRILELRDEAYPRSQCEPTATPSMPSRLPSFPSPPVDITHLGAQQPKTATKSV
jgi:hypothetical protein